jgi:hypothetical protein
MKPDDLLTIEMKNQLTFMVKLKESIKDLDARIRSASLYVASMDLVQRHPNIEDWELEEGPEDSMVRGRSDGTLKIIGKVKTMGLQGRVGMGGRQAESMKRAVEQIKGEGAEVTYMYLMDPWTVGVVQESFKNDGVIFLPLVHITTSRPHISETSRSLKEHQGTILDQQPEKFEEVITRDDQISEENIIVSPISRTSIRQGFIYIPKEKGHLVQEGPTNIWIRKDASIESRCMVSQTGGIRIGGNLTKWFKSIGLRSDDELVMAAQPDGSLLIMSIKRTSPQRGDTPMIENVKWD